MEKNNAAVIGYPIKHSLSPKIHNTRLKECGLEGSYKALEVRPENLESFLLSLKDNELVGINITIPHKETAYQIVKKYGKVSVLADRIKAINTVFFKEGKLFGTNTDYHGFKNSLFNQIPKFKFDGKKVLIIGAGGAAKAIVSGLLDEKDVEVILINRTLQRAEDLKVGLKNQIVTSGLCDIESKIEEVDLVVNTTSCGLEGNNNLEIDYNKIKSKKIFYDIVYKPLHTKMLFDAKQNGHQIVTGIGMLIHQAVPAFEHFFGVLPKITSDLEESLL